MLVVIFFSLLSASCPVALTKALHDRPNIIYVLADDLGWNDVSYHGSPEIPTPNIDAMAASGIMLERHYAAPQCTPSRAALLSGRYPMNCGLQHLVILAGQPSAMPLNMTTWPEHMKNCGYSTHLVGKWHLGAHKWAFTPTFRGFDTFFGIWNGEIDLYDYTVLSESDFWGIDLHDGVKPLMNYRGQYAGTVFTEKTEEIIMKHNESDGPLFLLLSQVVPHTGNRYQRLQAPMEHVKKFKHIEDDHRRTFAGAVSVLDECMGRIFSALHKKHMLNNSIVILVSDNGAEVEGQRGAYGSNWPLRGSKMRLYEGGVRVPALIWSPLFKLHKPRVSQDLMYICDWLPTLYRAAGGDVADLKNIDGIDMWESFMKNHPGKRTEVLLNIDPYFEMSALIQNDTKVVNGTFPSVYDNGRELWYAPSGRNHHVSSMDKWVWRNGSVVKSIMKSIGKWLIKKPDEWRKNVTVQCGSPPPAGNGGCDPKKAPCLFNIREDPCERHNLAAQQPQVVESMMKRIIELNSTSMVPLSHRSIDLTADPRCHGFVFVPWLEKEYASNRKLCKATAIRDTP